MTTLITFLGKGQTGGYRNTAYRFANGETVSTAYFGMALAEQTGCQHVRILGTTGSMWDALILDQFDTTGQESAWEDLAQAVASNRVSQTQLDALATQLSQNTARQYELKLIPYGLDDAEQIDILRALTEGLPDDPIILDVTHGFRHLPMLALLAIFYLRAARQQNLEAIYYGAYEHKDSNNITPVVRLDGMLKLYEWIRALENFNKDGDYGSFAGLLTAENLPGQHFAEAAFLERIANASLGGQKLTSAIQKLDETPQLSPAGELFRPLLKDRTTWHKAGSRAARERQLALDYLARRDYLRAAQFGYEARVSAATYGDPNDFATRKDADNELTQDSKDQAAESPANFRTLKNLRNALAHGVMDADPTGKMSKFIKRITAREAELQQWLTKALKEK